MMIKDFRLPTQHELETLPECAKVCEGECVTYYDKNDTLMAIMCPKAQGYREIPKE
jgi:hypothetical protein